MDEAVWVVIPYYQREAGLLHRTLESVFAQTLLPQGVLVVDDGSPHPARAEIALLADTARARVTIIEQPNAGPGAARNRALGAVPAAARFVAFIDSDDVWVPGHLEAAVRVLATGFDCFLGNWRSIDGGVDGWRRWHGFDPAELEAVPGHADAYDFSHRLGLAQLRAPLARLSSIVLDQRRLRHLRFDARYRHAAEDRRFGWEIARSGARTVLADRVCALAGRGIRIFASGAFGTLGALRVTLDQARFCHDLAGLDLPQAEAAALGELRAAVRHRFAVNWRANMMAGRPALALLRQYALLDPTGLARAPLLALRRLD